jgi:hypothetical protein
MWGTNWIYICYVEESRPPLWSSGQISWLQIQRSGLDSRRYQLFWEVVGLERGPLSLVSTTEELLDRKNSGSGLKSLGYGRRDPPRWPRGTPYPQKFALTSPTSGDGSIGIADSGHGVKPNFVSCSRRRTRLCGDIVSGGIFVLPQNIYQYARRVWGYFNLLALILTILETCWLHFKCDTEKVSL